MAENPTRRRSSRRIQTAPSQSAPTNSRPDPPKRTRGAAVVSNNADSDSDSDSNSSDNEPDAKTKKTNVNSTPSSQGRNNLRSRLTDPPQTPQQASTGQVLPNTPDSQPRYGLRSRQGSSTSSIQWGSTGPALPSTPDSAPRYGFRPRVASTPLAFPQRPAGSTRRRTLKSQRRSSLRTRSATLPRAPKRGSSDPVQQSTAGPSRARRTPARNPSRATPQARAKMAAPQPQVEQPAKSRQSKWPLIDPSTSCRICSAKFGDARELKFCRWLAWRLCVPCWEIYGRRCVFGPKVTGGPFDDKVRARGEEVKISFEKAKMEKKAQEVKEEKGEGEEQAHGVSSDPLAFDPDYALQALPQFPEFNPHGVFAPSEYPTFAGFPRIPEYGQYQAVQDPEAVQTPALAGPSAYGLNQDSQPPQPAPARRASFFDMAQVFQIPVPPLPTNSLTGLAPPQPFIRTRTNGESSRRLEQSAANREFDDAEEALKHHRQMIDNLLQGPTNLESLTIGEDHDEPMEDQENTAFDDLESILYVRDLERGI
ncbi:hypothetical protein BGZ61DRAFT_557326 [Ilyonectria robusta]|uniref:uncharacterized protein n=1 Tax=Ilyonectria robusta TaxID=1079257 RepID=UPI001E8D75F1|nr:uncharacterized protein BGZ61DRAFT_557326 [Ilyonectria robusta]KAH8670014.1 hypothetical protein BGZ61DRAFT_557326 [Ilyonectria robusta]